MQQVWRVKPQQLVKPLWIIARCPQKRAVAVSAAAVENTEEREHQMELLGPGDSQGSNGAVNESSTTQDKPSRRVGREAAMILQLERRHRSASGSSNALNIRKMPLSRKIQNIFAAGGTIRRQPPKASAAQSLRESTGNDSPKPRIRFSSVNSATRKTRTVRSLVKEQGDQPDALEVPNAQVSIGEENDCSNAHNGSSSSQKAGVRIRKHMSYGKPTVEHPASSHQRLKRIRSSATIGVDCKLATDPRQRRRVKSAVSVSKQSNPDSEQHPRGEEAVAEKTQAQGNHAAAIKTVSGQGSDHKHEPTPRVAHNIQSIQQRASSIEGASTGKPAIPHMTKDLMPLAMSRRGTPTKGQRGSRRNGPTIRRVVIVKTKSGRKVVRHLAFVSPASPGDELAESSARTPVGLPMRIGRDRTRNLSIGEEITSQSLSAKLRRRKDRLMLKIKELMKEFPKETSGGVKGRYQKLTLRSLEHLMFQIKRHISEHEERVIIRALFELMRRLRGRTEVIISSQQPSGKLDLELRPLREKLRLETTNTLLLLRKLASERQDVVATLKKDGGQPEDYFAWMERLREQFDYLNQLSKFWGTPQDLVELKGFLAYRKARELRSSSEDIDEDLAELPHEVADSTTTAVKTSAKTWLSEEEVEALIEKRIRDTFKDKRTSWEPEDSTAKGTGISRVAGFPNTSLYELLFPDDFQKPDLLSEDDDAIPRLPLPKLALASSESEVGNTWKDPFEDSTSEPSLKSQPSLDPDEAAILVLYNGSPSLTLQDFTAILPPTNHRAWTSRSPAHPVAPALVFPLRDPKTLERDRKDHYYLIFPSSLAARTYRDRAYRMYTLAKTYTPTSIESPLPPGPGTIVDGEDVYLAVKRFSLVPTTQIFHMLVMPKPYSAFVKGLIRRGGYAQLVGESGVEGQIYEYHGGVPRKAGEGRVMLEFYGGDAPGPTRTEIHEAIGIDGRTRGLAWRKGGIEAIRKIETESFRLGEQEKFAEEGIGKDKEGHREEKEGPKEGMHKWIVTFDDQVEAMRFARCWHHRKMLWKDPPVRGSGMEDQTMVKTELLW